MASRSCEVFVAGVDDEKLMAYLEEFHINADALSSDSESDGFSSDSSEGIVPDMPPMKKKRLNFDANNLSLSNAGDENISNNDISDGEINNEESFCEIPADQKDTFPTLPVSFIELTGPKHAPHPESSPITYFELFFTSALLNLIVAETNHYADQLLNALEL